MTPPLVVPQGFQEIEKREEHQTPVPMDLVQRAFDAGNLELVARAMELDAQWKDRQKSQDFEAALADIRGKIPLVIKNKAVNLGNNRGYRYEDLGAVVEAIDKVIPAYGINYRFLAETIEQMIPAHGDHPPRLAVIGVKVTCVLSHRNGYKETNSESASVDLTGNKNPIQAARSTKTYLQRSLLKDAFGLASTDGDDDGRSHGIPDDTGELMSEEHVNELQQALVFKGMPVERFIKWARLAYRGGQIEISRIEDIPDTCYEQCLNKIKTAGEPVEPASAN
jgi:ERF superfamily protein